MTPAESSCVAACQTEQKAAGAAHHFFDWKGCQAACFPASTPAEVTVNPAIAPTAAEALAALLVQQAEQQAAMQACAPQNGCRGPPARGADMRAMSIPSPQAQQAAQQTQREDQQVSPLLHASPLLWLTPSLYQAAQQAQQRAQQAKNQAQQAAQQKQKARLELHAPALLRSASHASSVPQAEQQAEQLQQQQGR
jgi:hypothetical protein